MEEIWYDIPDYEGYYKISNLKRIKSLERISPKGSLLREKILKTTFHGKYEGVWLSKNGKAKLFYLDNLLYKIKNKI